MRHNDAIHLLGRCLCPCHILRKDPAAQAACWCDTRTRTRKCGGAAEPTPGQTAAARAAVERAGGWWTLPPIAHRDAVKYLHYCECPCHLPGGSSYRDPACACNGRTDPALAAAFRRKDNADLKHRLVTGRATPTEYLRYAPGVLRRH